MMYSGVNVMTEGVRRSSNENNERRNFWKFQIKEIKSLRKMKQALKCLAKIKEVKQHRKMKQALKC